MMLRMNRLARELEGYHLPGGPRYKTVSRINQCTLDNNTSFIIALFGIFVKFTS